MGRGPPFVSCGEKELILNYVKNCKDAGMRLSPYAIIAYIVVIYKKDCYETMKYVSRTLKKDLLEINYWYHTGNLCSKYCKQQCTAFQHQIHQQQLQQLQHQQQHQQHNNNNKKKKMEVDTERGAAVSSTDTMANNKPNDIGMPNNMLYRKMTMVNEGISSLSLSIANRRLLQ